MQQETNNHTLSASAPVRIDLDEVLSLKLGKKARWIPGFFVSWLKRTVHQDELNDILCRYHGLEGAEFCRAMVGEFDLNLKVSFPYGQPDKDRKRVIIVCNHPLGGLDGIALIAFFKEYYGMEPRFVVNDILMAVEPLRRVFIPVNKHGAQTRDNLSRLDEALAGDRPIIIFPAGLVSRKNDKGEIRDLRWNKMFISKALQYQRNILPVFFGGHNSSFFYNLARWRARLKVPFNIEMLYLPDELMKSRGKSFTITVGKEIDCASLSGKNPAETSREIKEIVYSLGKNI